MFRISAVNWKEREYVVRGTLAVMEAFKEKFDEEIAIGEVELSDFCMCVVAWTWEKTTVRKSCS